MAGDSRPRCATHLDPFVAFSPWDKSLRDQDRLAWRDGLPTAVDEPPDAAEHPPLVRAIERVRQFARANASIAPWLGLPFALRDLGLSASPLPCLTGGARALRIKAKPNEAEWLAVLRDLRGAADAGLARLDDLERHYRDAGRAIVAEFRPGTLPRLLALSQHRPLLSPQGVADRLRLSVAGASKLLDRATALGLLVEVTRRRSWRQFLTPDLAIAFGYARPRRGRPAKEPPPLAASRDLTAVFDAFDQEMAALDPLLGNGTATA